MFADKFSYLTYYNSICILLRILAHDGTQGHKLTAHLTYMDVFREDRQKAHFQKDIALQLLLSYFSLKSGVRLTPNLASFIISPFQSQYEYEKTIGCTRDTPVIYRLFTDKFDDDASLTSGYLDLVQRLEFGVDHLQKNAVYQIE